MRATALVLLLSLGGTAAADAPRRAYDTRRAQTPPHIDGLVDDAAWGGVEWSTDFVQRDPAEGVPPTRQTRFKVLYDDQALYFAFRAEDDPGGLASLLDRRDRFPGDWVEVNVDSYFDRRTAFSFTLSLSGTRGDEFISNDGNNWDGNWDPIWQGATHVDAEGWTAEMRIPLSQLRFSGEDNQTWGLQVQRRIFRKDERSTWQVIPKGENAWVSRFGELRGITGLKPRARRELSPYTVARAERLAPEPGNPLHDPTPATLTAGLDGKIGLTSDLTVDFTVNPDFGQVEADPSQVNLTAFETFFAERRPFFVESSNIFDLRLAPAITGGHFTSDRLFYSRRIGAPPPRSADLGDGEYSEEPARTSILGAFKLSGKTPGGLAVGVLDSLTGHERAQVDGPRGPRREDVAPLANSFVARAQQDFRGGDTQIGGMLTSVIRDLGSGPLAAALPRQAWAGGFDFAHYLHQREYLIEGNVLGSHLRGSPEAIAAVQTSSARYFQRPDQDRVRFDPTRTSLSGHAGSLRLTRATGRSHLRFQTGAAWRSPGFEINDLGFMGRADEINQFGWAAWQIRNPFSIFRGLQWNANEWMDWDFGGRALRRAVNTNGNATFLNNWRVGGSLTRDFAALSNTELRGGPASRWPGRWSWSGNAYTDPRRKLQIGIGLNGERGDEGSLSSRELWMETVYRPTNALTISLNPSFSTYRPELQYVDTVSSGSGSHAVFGRLDQDTAALTVRADLALSPNLTIQLYGAPFVSSGRYSGLSQIVAPGAGAYRDRFRTFGGALSADGGGYGVDEDGDGRSDYGFDRPDFDVREFNSTLVARWEYKPGSVLFLVWSQARSDSALGDRDLGFGRGLSDLWRSHPHDVFLVKFSRWLPL